MNTEADQDLKKLIWEQFGPVKSTPSEEPSAFIKFFDTSDTLGVVTVAILAVVFISLMVLAVRSILRMTKGKLSIKLDSSGSYFSSEKISGTIEIEVHHAVSISELRLRLLGVRTNDHHQPDSDSINTLVDLRVVHNEVTVLEKNLHLHRGEKKKIPFSLFLPHVEDSALDLTFGKNTSWSLEAQAEIPGVNLADTVSIQTKESMGNNI